MMNEFRDTDDYRLRGGVIYVLDTMLSRNPTEKSGISSALEEDDFPFLYQQRPMMTKPCACRLRSFSNAQETRAAYHTV